MEQINQKLTDAEKVLAELVSDVEAVGGGKYLGHEWPDLLITYNKAKHILNQASKR